MGRLIRAEFLKLSKSLGYKILLICMAGVGVLVGCLFTFVEMGQDVNGCFMYLQLISEIQIPSIIASVFAAAFIGGEFSDRTFGVSVMSGCTRLSLLTAKAIAYIAGLLSLVFIYPVIGTAVTSIVMGFGETSPEILRHFCLTTFLFALGIVAIGGFCLALAMLIKNVGGTVGAGIGLLLLLILPAQLSEIVPALKTIMRFNFTYQMAQAAQPESLALYFAVIIATIAVTLFAAKVFFEKSELK